MAVSNESNKKYSTDERDMMETAKQYARQDYKQTWDLFCELIEEDMRPTEEEVAQALLKYKYEQIKKARTNRVSFYD